MLNLFGFMPMPIIIPMGTGSGKGDPNAFIAMLIVVNMICMSIVLVRSVIWLFKYKRHEKERKENYLDTPTFIRYVIIGNDMEADYMGAFINFLVFCSINGLAIFIGLIDLVMKMLS